MPELTGSVGYDGNTRGDNRLHDICLVQVMLRLIKSPTGRPYANFGYSGRLRKDHLTHKAIKRFQQDNGLPTSTSRDKLGLVAVGGPTFERMVAMLPSNMKTLRTIENLKLVYLEGSAAAANASASAVASNTKFVNEFRAPLVKLIRDMYRHYGIVLSLVDRSGSFRTFDYQSQLYSRGRENGLKRVTGAGPGESNHNYGNGADIGMRGFTWITPSGRTKRDNSWLGELKKSRYAAARAQLWKIRNRLTTLHPSGWAKDLIHLQSFRDSHVSMIQSLVTLLNAVGNMRWEYKCGEYRCNFGLGNELFNIGSGRSSAQAIWKQRCDVSGSRLAKALNQATERREANGGTLPPHQEQIYLDLMSVYDEIPSRKLRGRHIKPEQYDKMRGWLREDFELAEENYMSWQAVDADGKVISPPRQPPQRPSRPRPDRRPRPDYTRPDYARPDRRPRPDYQRPMPGGQGSGRRPRPVPSSGESSGPGRRPRRPRPQYRPHR